MSSKKHRISYLMVTVLLCTQALFFLGSCSGSEKKLPVNVEEVHVTIPGMESEVKLAYLSDLHIVALSDEIAEDQKATVQGRMDYFSHDGVTSKDQLEGWIRTLNDSSADYVLFGGDMVDFSSKETTGILKKGMEGLNKPYMYIRADHDTTPSYIDRITLNMGTEYQETIGEMSDVYVEEFPDFCVVGWNNSTSPLSVSGMEKIRAAKDLGKHMILLTHVPIAPRDDNSLCEKSEEAFDGRDLIWGDYAKYSYFPNDSPEGEATAELLNMLYSEDSPFVEVLCGHLHFSWDGYISEHVHQHVFSAAFNRYMGEITVSGE